MTGTTTTASAAPIGWAGPLANVERVMAEQVAPGSDGRDRVEGPAADDLRRFRQELAGMPPEEVVANHAYGLFELAALYLSLEPPRPDAAKLAIDALAGLLAPLGGRLGDDEPPLRDNLSQVKLALVRLESGLPGTPA